MATSETDKVKMARITVGVTKLRNTAAKSGVALYNLNSVEEYEILEEKTDTDGNLWYRLKFYYNDNNWRSGWVLAEFVEVFYG